VLLSTRDVDGWWTSASNTIFAAVDHEPMTEMVAERQMIFSLFDNTFTPGWQDETAAKAAYVAHNDAVRAAAPADRLVEHHPGDGWGPLCAALDLPVPDMPYPHANSTSEFRAMTGLDSAG
jgi:Sulfotransferase domain